VKKKNFPSCLSSQIAFHVEKKFLQVKFHEDPKRRTCFSRHGYFHPNSVHSAWYFDLERLNLNSIDSYFSNLYTISSLKPNCYFLSESLTEKAMFPRSFIDAYTFSLFVYVIAFHPYFASLSFSLLLSLGR